MKKFGLTVFFTIYHFFMPFVWLNCSGPDAQYIVAENETEVSLSLEECQARSVLTEDCVDLIQAQIDKENSENITLISAEKNDKDFISCYNYLADDESEELDCSGLIATMQDAYNICTAFELIDDKREECFEIEPIVNEAILECDQSSANVSDDFCALLSA